MNTTTDSRKAFCTFRVDGLLYGIEVHRIQEVFRGNLATEVPLADPTVNGLMNLRGQIVTVLNLRQCIGLRHQPDEHSMNVVVRSADGPVSLMVDEIGDVVEVRSDRFEPCPEPLLGKQRELIKGAYKLDSELLLILDTHRVLEVAA